MHADPPMPNYDNVVRDTSPPEQWGDLFYISDNGENVDLQQVWIPAREHVTRDNCPTWRWVSMYNGECRCMVEPL